VLNTIFDIDLATPLETHSKRERADRRQQRAERRRPRREARLGEQRGEGARARGRAQHVGDMGVFIIRLQGTREGAQISDLRSLMCIKDIYFSF